jgi:Ser/Thr protein kinase RdoA (MazF antagonist)
MIAAMQPTREEKLHRMQSVAQRALRHWNLEGVALEVLKYRENAVFKVTAAGEQFALRVHRPGYHTDDALRSELQWMDALAADGFAVPRIVPTPTGELFTVVRHTGISSPVQVDLFEWIEGRQLGSVEAGLDGDAASIGRLYRTLGAIAGCLHNQAQDWRPPPGFSRHSWDEHGLAGEEPFWGRFWELPQLTPDRRRLLTAARDRVYADLATLPKVPAIYSMIHADFCQENLLVDGERVRLIDFDDSGFGWHLFELVTPLYFLMDEPYFDEVRDAVIAGYRSARPLPDAELERLPLFMLARGLTYVGWVHTRPETETARDMTPKLIDWACELAEDYLGTRRSSGRC